MRVLNGKGIFDFLRKRVQHAINDSHIETSEMAEFYLVNLLNDYLIADKLYNVTSGTRDEDPLAIQLLRAINNETKSGKISQLKTLGDRTLYIIGLFNEHITTKKSVSVDYYKSIGAGAYLSISNIIGQNDIAEMYQELSDNFISLSRILGVAAMPRGDLRASQLLKIYERWQNTGNDNLLKILKKYGLAIPDSKDAQ